MGSYLRSCKYRLDTSFRPPSLVVDPCILWFDIKKAQ